MQQQLTYHFRSHIHTHTLVSQHVAVARPFTQWNYDIRQQHVDAQSEDDDRSCVDVFMVQRERK